MKRKWKRMNAMKYRKQLLCLCISTMILSSSVLAVQQPTFSSSTPHFSGVADWAYQDLIRADQLGLVHLDEGADVSVPILRKDFALHSAGLVAKIYHEDVSSWAVVADIRNQKAGVHSDWSLAATLAHQLGILQGRGGNQLDERSEITRQEAAVMLARAYRLYGTDIPPATSTSYIDEGEIAPWALQDVALMSQLGIMNGMGENKFQPQDPYTIQQCIVTILRLYEKTGQSPLTWPSPMTLTRQEEALVPHWDSDTYMFCYAEHNGDITYVWAKEGSPRGMIYRISYMDRNQNYQEYRSILCSPTGLYMGGSAAPITKIAFSPAGEQVIYTGIVEADMYPALENGVKGDLLFQKGIYHVTIDLSTGRQSYAKATP